MSVYISPEKLSSIIEKIYDSAIDPELWPATLEDICGLIGATLGLIGTFDAREKTMRWTPRWGGDPYWMKLLHDKYTALMPFWSIMPQYAIGEVADTRDMVRRIRGDEEEIRKLPFFKEWAEPAGYYDVAATVVMRNDHRTASFNLHTPPTRGPIGPDDIAILNLINPHIRRSVMIGDLLGMQSLASGAFEATLNSLTAAVVLVDVTGPILYSNHAAQKTFETSGSILSQNGLLGAHDASAAWQRNRLIGAISPDIKSTHMGSVGATLRLGIGH